MHFLRKEHNLSKKLCSIFLRNLTIHPYAAGYSPLTLWPSSAWEQEELTRMDQSTGSLSPPPSFQLDSSNGWYQWGMGGGWESRVWLPPAELLQVGWDSPPIVTAPGCWSLFSPLFHSRLVVIKSPSLLLAPGASQFVVGSPSSCTQFCKHIFLTPQIPHLSVHVIPSGALTPTPRESIFH